LNPEKKPLTPLDFPFADPPEPGELAEVAPGILWQRMPLPFVLDHVNLWLIRDGAGWAAVDCGYGLDAVKAQWEQTLARLDGPITRIIVTHFHPDHLGLGQWLHERTGAPLTMTAAEYLSAHLVMRQEGGLGMPAMVNQFRRHGLDEERLAAQTRLGNGYLHGVPSLPQRYDRLFDGSEIVTGSGANAQRWKVLVGYGHSPEHASFYSAQAGVLISGDMLLPRISTNVSVYALTPNANSLEGYLSSIDRYTALPPQTLVLPSHGLPFIGIHSRVAAQREHHEERLEMLLEACDKPKTTADLLPTLFPRSLDAHQLMFAMGEAIAHLNYLEHAGRLLRSETSDGVIRFLRNESHDLSHPR